MWSRRRGRGMLYNDIFEIEAVGPAIILDQWGRKMRNTMSLHFIDNVGAQAALCRGSSSVHEGDLIVGHTWSAIAKFGIYAWFDRVASAANPVDKLSRGTFKGPWAAERHVALPGKLTCLLRREL